MKNKALTIVKTTLAVASFLGAASLAYAQGAGGVGAGDSTYTTVGTIGGGTITCPTPSSTTWNGAPATPPNCNAPGPVNTGSATQTKNGVLALNGLAVWGASSFAGNAFFGPYDGCYYAPCSTGGGSGGVGGGLPTVSLPQHFALRDSTKSLVASALDSLKPATAYAYGTSSTDAIYVNGTARVNGPTYTTSLMVTPHSLFVSDDQGGSMELGGTNSLANTASKMPYIDFHFGTGTVQDYNTRIINNANDQLEVDAGKFILSGKVGVGTGTTAPRSSIDVWGGVIDVTGVDHNGTAVVTSQGGYAYYGNNNYANGLSIAPSGEVGIGKTAASGVALDVNGTINATNESHFSNGAYVDPQPGVAASIKANSIAAGSIYVPGEVPLYLDHCHTGGVVTMNPNTSGGCTLVTNGDAIGFLLPAPKTALSNTLGGHITGVTLGTPDYVHNTVPATLHYHIDGGSNAAVTQVDVFTKTGSVLHWRSYPRDGAVVQPGNDGDAIFNGANNLQCSPDSDHSTGYSMWVEVKNTFGNQTHWPGSSSPSTLPRSAEYTYSVGPC